MATIKKQVKKKVYTVLKDVGTSDKCPPQALLIVKTIKDAGCYRLFFGGESADDRLQKYTDKGFNSERIREVLQMLRGTGLHVHMSTIVGFPTEVPEETDNTVAMVS